MKRTVVSFSTHFDKMKIEDHSIFLGSCFSNNIGSEFIQLKMNALVNPFGVIFHPLAIFNVMERAIDARLFVENDFFESDNYWFCFELGSSVGFEGRQEAVMISNQYLDNLRKELVQSERIFITFGSAYGYYKNEEIVANCHKQPSQLFTKKLTSVEEISEVGTRAVRKAQAINSNLKFVFTVSPVRHLKDTLSGNSVSKSVLRIVCEELCLSLKNVEYFPVYEKVMDEMRDYLFFKTDGIHLNDLAIDEVFEWVQRSFFSEELIRRNQEVAKVLKMMNHKSLFPKSISNKAFKNGLLLEMERLNKQNEMDWTAEIQRIKNQLKKLE